MAERSKELFQVGYYLSKFGKSLPPERLKSEKWNEVYQMFYDALHSGRTVLAFEHSLKNVRDGFDGYFEETQREGWKSSDGSPSHLTGIAATVFKEFSDKSETEIWAIVDKYADPNTQAVVFKDLIAEDTANSDSDKTYTEGRERVRISKSIERNANLREKALAIHGYECQVCGFDFQKSYGSWGSGFAEVHHMIPLALLKGRERKTNPNTDLAVLCANCHRMVHRKKGITLTIEELKAKLNK